MRQEQKSLPRAIAVGTLLFATAGAFAQMPADPGNQPGPFPAPANGGLTVAVYDDVRGVSLIEYLGFNYGNFQPGNVTPESGGTIDFGREVVLTFLSPGMHAGPLGGANIVARPDRRALGQLD